MADERGNITVNVNLDPSQVENWLQHSILLNKLSWRMAIALGDAEPTVDASGQVVADPVEMLERLIAKANGQTELDITGE